MADLTVSANVDTLLSAADNAAMRTALGLTALATTTPGTGVATFLATPSGANLASALTTALPATKGGTGLTSLGTGVATALGVNVGSTGAPVVFNGAGGTPSSIVLTNATAVPAGQVAGVIPIANLATGTPNGAKFVRDDGVLATPSGSGTVTATGGSLTANAVVLGAGTTDTKVSTGITSDGSGSLTLTGGVALGSGGSTAGVAEFGQGTAPSDGTTSVKIYADTSVTSYKVKLPSAAGTTGLLQWAVSGTTITLSSVTTLPSGITLVAPVLGTPASGNLSGCTSDGTNPVGSSRLPLNAKTGGYTLLASDLGKIVPNTTGGWTVNNSVHTAGDVISLYNDSGSSQNITAGTISTMRLAGTTTTGTRALAARGLATLYFNSASEVIVSGVGVT